MSDMVNHPKHYTQAGVMLEPIDVLRFAPFDLGNCLKYILRAGHKGDALEDWKKAQKYAYWTIDSHVMNPKPYDEFLKHYGLLLYKFEAFKVYGEDFIESNFEDFISDLLKFIDENIKGEHNDL